MVMKVPSGFKCRKENVDDEIYFWWWSLLLSDLVQLPLHPTCSSQKHLWQWGWSGNWKNVCNKAACKNKCHLCDSQLGDDGREWRLIMHKSISLTLRRAWSLYLLAACIPPCTLTCAISSGWNDVSRQSDLKSLSCGASQNVCDSSGCYLPAVWALECFLFQVLSLSAEHRSSKLWNPVREESRVYGELRRDCLCQKKVVIALKTRHMRSNRRQERRKGTQGQENFFSIVAAPSRGLESTGGRGIRPCSRQPWVRIYESPGAELW